MIRLQSLTQAGLIISYDLERIVGHIAPGVFASKFVIVSASACVRCEDRVVCKVEDACLEEEPLEQLSRAIESRLSHYQPSFIDLELKSRDVHELCQLATKQILCLQLENLFV